MPLLMTNYDFSCWYSWLQTSQFQPQYCAIFPWEGQSFWRETEWSLSLIYSVMTAHSQPSQSDDVCIYSVLTSTIKHSSIFDIYINTMWDFSQSPNERKGPWDSCCSATVKAIWHQACLFHRRRNAHFNLGSQCLPFPQFLSHFENKPRMNRWHHGRMTRPEIKV